MRETSVKSCSRTYQMRKVAGGGCQVRRVVREGAHLAPHQRGGRGEDDELGEGLAQVGDALVLPLVPEVGLSLVDDLGDHRLERAGVHRVDEHLHLRAR